MRRVVGPFDLGRHQDQAGTGAVQRHAGPGPLSDRIAKLEALEELSDRRRLPARHDERIDAIEVLRITNLHRSCAGTIQGARVLADISLQRENAYLQGGLN